MADDIKVLEDSALPLSSVVDGFTTTELQKRYGLKSRSTLSNRMEALGITAYRGCDNRRFYVSMEGVKALDELNKCLERNGAKLEECAAKIKDPLHSGSARLEIGSANSVPSIPIAQLQLPEELIQILTLFLDRQVDPFQQYDVLAKACREGYHLPTSKLLPLLGRKSIPKLDDHGRFSQMGFVFWRSGKVGRQAAWEVTK